MQEPLKEGDRVMVVRDLQVIPLHPCYGKLIGTPATLEALHERPYSGIFGPLWQVKEKLRCPCCRGASRLFMPGELQKLRGPEQRSDVSELIGVDENGNGWRPTTSEVGS